MAIAILGQTVFNANSVATSYTFSFNVPAGTDTLLVLPIFRTTGGSGDTSVSITHNGVALTSGFSNYTAGSAGSRINSYIGYRRNPDVGTFNIVLTCTSVSGGPCWVLALSGVAAAGNPVGNTAAQRSSSSSTTIGLGLTPTAGSLLLTVLGSGNSTGTVTDFTGTGFTETATGRYSANGDLPATSRYLLDATATAKTVSATFSVAGVNNGGLLAEILVEATGTDVAGTAAATLGVTGSVSTGLSKAEIVDASFRQLTAWTEVVSLQADAAGVDRRIISAGVAGSPTMTLDQLAPNKNYSWRYRLADGMVQIDSGNNTQSLSPQHLVLAHNGALGQELYLDGAPVGTVITGGGLSGAAVVQGGEIIGSYGGASPAPYTGLIGRYLLAEFAMTPEQVRLLALSETDPDALWGVGVEDDSQAANQSVVACPLSAVFNGQPSATISPRILDPSGGVRGIFEVIQPANGKLAISGLDLIYTPNRGWQGTDSTTYTATDGTTFSTGRLTLQQTRPALRCTNDTVTVASGGVVTFDPRSNDVGAGNLRVVSYTGTAHGAVSTNADGTLRYTNVSTDSATSDSFSYTVADDYGQQTATVSITISGGSFLIANPVSANTTKNTFIDVDVVAAADVSADLAPAVVKAGSITAPALGTAALQTSGKIRYTPPTGDDGFSEGFDFTLKPSAKALPESTNTVTVSVQTVSSDLPKYQPDVAVNKWHCVGFTQAGSKKDDYGTGRAGFAAAVASSSLAAGDVIVLADGTYSGALLECARNGAAGNHIMVRARTHGKAVVDHQLLVSGTYWWFTGIKFTYTGNANPNFTTMGQTIRFNNAGFWLTNCKFTGYAFLRMTPNNAAKNIRICYNDCLARPPATATDTSPFLLCHSFEQGDALPSDTEIAWNRITSAPKPNDQAVNRAFLLVHSGHAHKVDANEMITRSFRFHHNHCVGAWAEAIYLKRQITFEYNYIKWTDHPAYTLWSLTWRHGLISDNPRYDIGGICRGNTLDTSRRIIIWVVGTGMTVTNNNRIGSGSGLFRVQAGDIDNESSSAPPPRDGADNAQLVENFGFGDITMGYIYSGDGRVGGETGILNRNGWPSNVRLYRGSSSNPWNPTIGFDSDSSGATCPTGNLTKIDGYGTGSAAKVTPITEAELLNASPPVGCDPMP